MDNKKNNRISLKVTYCNQKIYSCDKKKCLKGVDKSSHKRYHIAIKSISSSNAPRSHSERTTTKTSTAVESKRKEDKNFIAI